MKVYLVGGAVRDELLGLPVKERDWVVVGTTPEAMLAQGYKPVGKDFPVFLHPQTHEEYALARTERKVGKGYTGFEFYAAPNVTLEEDLRRRDLTINAMAKTLDGAIIDPYGGQQDLKQHILRHISPAFAEDPVRILRIARFAARFSHFTIHPETLQLMRGMVQAGEVDALVAERVWQELERALLEKHPERFFLVLNECGALKILFPPIYTHQAAITALKNAVILSNDSAVRFASLFYHADGKQVEVLCNRYRVPRDYRDLALLVIRHHESYEQTKIQSVDRLLKTLEALDAFRRPQRFENFLLACEANLAKEFHGSSQHLKQAYQAAAKVSTQALLNQGLNGKAIADALHQLRLQAIEKIL